MLVLVWCVTGRLWLSIGMLLGLTVGLSAVNVAKMSILTEPLFPSDHQFLSSPEFLVEMVYPGDLVAARGRGAADRRRIRRCVAESWAAGTRGSAGPSIRAAVEPSW